MKKIKIMNLSSNEASVFERNLSSFEMKRLDFGKQMIDGEADFEELLRMSMKTVSKELSAFEMTERDCRVLQHHFYVETLGDLVQKEKSALSKCPCFEFDFGEHIESMLNTFFGSALKLGMKMVNG